MLKDEVKNRNILEIINTLNQYLQGKENQIILTLIAFFSKGHVLIEDLPGVGKTTLALSISKALGLKFGRIQCTSDLLPSDITGMNIYNKLKNKFEFQKGPIFNNIVLVDEINRATQKTQSALLEAMEEKQVTIDGKTYKLEEPFFVIATQNPVEFSGTFNLPQSQMDRFIISYSIGYPDKNREIEILKHGSSRNKIENLQQVVSNEILNDIFKKIDNVYVSEKVLNYIVEVANRIRNSNYFIYGISPRASLSLKECAKTLAYFCNRDYVNIYDVKILSPFILSHRLILSETFTSIDKREIILEIINSIPVNV